MSADEDTELRDLVSQTLENNGSLAKIRAQLRASVFLAFDEDELIQKKQPLLNTKLKKHSATAEGKLMFCIVREFLEYFNLNYTLSVYEPESYFGTDYYYEGRKKLSRDLKLEPNETVPILVQLIKIAQEYSSDKNVTNGSENENHLENNIKVNGMDPGESRNGLHQPEILNETFVLSPKRVEAPEEKVEAPEEKIETPRSVESTDGKDDTYEGTSSIAEDSVKDKSLIDLDKSVKTSSSHNTSDHVPKSLLDSTINEVSPPVVRDSKLSPQKLKSKTSLSDFPPLHLNKFRNNEAMLLPSLRAGEFKDRPNEIEKLFESDPMDNYEEDFMSGSEVDGKSEKSLKLTNLYLKQRGDVKDRSDVTPNDSVASSVSSEDFELNSNIDDILNSNDTN